MKKYYRFLIALLLCACMHFAWAQQCDRPNILLIITDDQNWRDLSAYGNKVVSTPNFDSLAASGILFREAYANSPSCTPTRNSLLTGREPYELEQGAFITSSLPSKFNTYPRVLEKAGYRTGVIGKGAAPAMHFFGGWDTYPEGNLVQGEFFKESEVMQGINRTNYAATFDKFLNSLMPQEPFVMWMGIHEPHAPYSNGQGQTADIDCSQIVVPPVAPDEPSIKQYLCDYYAEVKWLDIQIGRIVETLKKYNQYDNTLIVITSDNGIWFPQGKTTLYELGTHVPLSISWKNGIQGGREVSDFVPLSDLASTFLDAAGVSRENTTIGGNSLMPILKDEGTDVVRDHVVTALERHLYPTVNETKRAVFTEQYAYIYNFPCCLTYDTLLFRPALDNSTYESQKGSFNPTALLERYRNHPKIKPYWERWKGTRSEHELYDRINDPFQLNNLAYLPAYQDAAAQMHARLFEHLSSKNDPALQPVNALHGYTSYTGQWLLDNPDAEQTNKTELSKKGLWANNMPTVPTANIQNLSFERLGNIGREHLEGILSWTASNRHFITGYEILLMNENLEVDKVIAACGNTFSVHIDESYRPIIGVRAINAVGKGPMATLPIEASSLLLLLGNDTILEQSPPSTFVGKLRVEGLDANAPYSFALDSTASHSGLFYLLGDSLYTSAVVDRKQTHSLHIRVRATDWTGLRLYRDFSVYVRDVNERPTSVALDTDSAQEHMPIGTVVGRLQAEDPDSGDVHAFTLLDNVPDNSAFRIENDYLLTNRVLNIQYKASYRIVVRATDRQGLAVVDSLPVRVVPNAHCPSLQAAGDIDFGRVLYGGGAQVLSYTIANTGMDTLVISGIYTDNAAFSVLGSMQAYVPPGGALLLRVSFSPVNEGANSASIVLLTNDCTSPSFLFTARGDAVRIGATQMIGCDTSIIRSLYQEPRCSAVVGATSYRFNIYSDAGLNNLVATYVSNTLRKLKLIEVVPALRWGTTYYVQVAAQIGTLTGPWGSPCILKVMPEPVSVPAPVFSGCNMVWRVSEVIRPLEVVGANRYDFEVYRGTILVGAKTSQDASERTLVLGSISGVVSGQTYRIRAKAYIGLLSSSWSPFCTIKTVQEPMGSSRLTNTFCNITVSSAQDITAISIVNANRYTFALYRDEACTSLADSVTVPRSFLNIGTDRPSLPVGAYYVRVRPWRQHTSTVRVHGTYGLACMVTYRNFSTVGGTRLITVQRNSTLPTSSAAVALLVNGASHYTFAFYRDPAATVLADSFSITTNKLPLTAMPSGVYYVRVRSRIGSLQGSFGATDMLTVASSGIRVVPLPAEEPEISGLNAYPNPSSGKAMVSFFPEEEGPSELTVYFGDREVRRCQFEGGFQQEIDLGEQSGLYLLRLVSQGKIYTQKIMVVK